MYPYTCVLLVSLMVSVDCGPIVKFNIPKLYNNIKACIAIPCVQLILSTGGPDPVNAVEQPVNPVPIAKVSQSTNNVPLYFGVGCFWHVQHEFVETERSVLGRTDDQLTALAGYAGGSKTGADGTVCYHNMGMKSDYGSLGHGEVVGMNLPKESIKDFADEYFSLFKNGDRPDRGDRGPEYRSLVGIPGGVKNTEIFQVLEAKARNVGITLVEGKGNDPDTLDKKIVYVMDSTQFPFYQGEIYHQYHDGFMPGEQYSQKYNSLVSIGLKNGLIKSVGCPDVKIP